MSECVINVHPLNVILYRKKKNIERSKGEKNHVGFNVGGMSIQILRFAHGIAIIAENEEDLTSMLEKTKEHHTEINQRKIKALLCDLRIPT